MNKEDRRFISRDLFETIQALSVQKGGEFVRMRNGELHFNQTHIGDISGIPQETLSRWKSGKGQPRLNELVALSNAMGVNVSQLIGELPIRSIDGFQYSSKSIGEISELIESAPEDVSSVIFNRIAGMIEGYKAAQPGKKSP